MDGGAHVTCMQAHSCCRRAMEWSGELTDQDVWRMLTRFGRTRLVFEKATDEQIERCVSRVEMAQSLSKLSEAQLELFEERAAIMEYDGEIDRETAERLALFDVAA